MRRSRPTIGSTASGTCAWPRPARSSVSVFKPVQFFGSLATLMEVDIPTGRTHQIRVHARLRRPSAPGRRQVRRHERNAELKGSGSSAFSCTRSRWRSNGRDRACRFTSARRCPPNSPRCSMRSRRRSKTQGRAARRRAAIRRRRGCGPRPSRGLSSGKLEARRAQHVAQPDQRQADERARIVAVDRFAQRDAEPFALESAGTIERRFAAT